MQPPDWNDLRYLLAIKRGQTLRAAARQLRVDDTTVSRRLASLERGLGRTLVQRLGDGRLVLTESGERVARDAEAMERHSASIAALVDGDGDACAGTVRVTAVPILANRLFVRNFGDLAARHPGLVVELIPDGRDFNLTRREADVAVRLARPGAGGMSVKTHRIGTLTYCRLCGARHAASPGSIAALDHLRRLDVPSPARAMDGTRRTSSGTVSASRP